MVVRKKNVFDGVSMRVLSVQEQAAIEEAWERSPEKAALDDRRRRAQERIDTLGTNYSKRC